MTDAERKALVEELLAAAVPANVAITDKAAACIHTDGQRIAELEAALQAIVPDYEELVRYADDTGAIRSWVEDAHARIAQANAALGGKG